MIFTAKIAGTLAALLIGSGGGVAASALVTSATAPVPHAGYACVNLSTHTTMSILDTPSASCPAGTTSIVLGAQGPAGPAGPAGPQGPQGPGFQVVAASAQTDITNDQDSGNNGNWAIDTLTRQITVVRHGQVAASLCGGTATNGITGCWFYTALLSDSGSFTTITGASSPNAGTAIHGKLTGSVTGGSAFEFYANSNDPQSSLVPATLDASTSGTDSSNWPARFFTPATAIAGMNEINWTYTYDAPTTCETWVDAFNNGDGGRPADGDITGVNACTS